MKNSVPTGILILLILHSSAVLGSTHGSYCKWTDQQGTTHYAEQCPETVEGEMIDLQGAASSLGGVQAGAITSPSTFSGRFRSLPLEQLGAPPRNATSVYLRTRSADYRFEANMTGRFYLHLEPREALPEGVLLEAHFPNPANPAETHVVEGHLETKKSLVTLGSLPSGGFKCWNYQVEVRIFRTPEKKELLGVHRQTLQSRVDMDLITNVNELAGAMIIGRCPEPVQAPQVDPSDWKGMEPDELDQLCESAREERLKPEREVRVKYCVEKWDRDEKWCSNYYADYGDAMRLGPGRMRPALYYDLPECLAARQARESEDP